MSYAMVMNGGGAAPYSGSSALKLFKQMGYSGSSVQKDAPYIEQYANQYHVPLPLAVSQAAQESSGRESARSSSGAIGVYQLLNTTASGLGVNPYNRQQNIQGGLKYDAQMLAKYGNWSRALAAYNAGNPASPAGQAYASQVLGRAGIQGGSAVSTPSLYPGWMQALVKGFTGFLGMSSNSQAVQAPANISSWQKLLLSSAKIEQHSLPSGILGKANLIADVGQTAEWLTFKIAFVILGIMMLGFGLMMILSTSTAQSTLDFGRSVAAMGA